MGSKKKQLITQDKIEVSNQFSPFLEIRKKQAAKKQQAQQNKKNWAFVKEKETSTAPNVSWAISWDFSEKRGYMTFTSMLSITGINGANYHTLIPPNYTIDSNQCFDKQSSNGSQGCIKDVPQNLPLVDLSKPLVQASRAIEVPEAYFYRGLRTLVDEVTAQFEWYLNNIAAPVSKNQDPEITVQHRVNGTVFRTAPYCLNQMESLQAATLDAACSMLGAEKLNEDKQPIVAVDTQEVARELPLLRSKYSCSQEGTPFSLMYNSSTQSVQRMKNIVPETLITNPALKQDTETLQASYSALIAKANRDIPPITSNFLDHRAWVLEHAPKVVSAIENNAAIEFSINPDAFLKKCPPEKLALDTAKATILNEAKNKDNYNQKFYVGIGITVGVGCFLCYCLPALLYLVVCCRFLASGGEEESNKKDRWCCCFSRKKTRIHRIEADDAPINSNRNN